MIQLTTARFRFKDADWNILRDVSISLTASKGKSTSTFEVVFNNEDDFGVVSDIPAGVYTLIAASDNLRSFEQKIHLNRSSEIHDVYLGAEDDSFLSVSKNQKIIIRRNENNLGILVDDVMNEQGEKELDDFLKTIGNPKREKSKASKSCQVLKFKKKVSRRYFSSLMKEVRNVIGIGPLLNTDTEDPIFLTGLVYAKFTSNSSYHSIAELTSQNKFDIVRRVPQSDNVYLLKYNDLNDYSLIEAINQLAQLEDVEEFTPCLPITPENTAVVPQQPVGTMTPFQWNLDLLDMPYAWGILKEHFSASHDNLKFGSPDVTIAVVDNGIDTNDPYDSTPETITTAVHSDFSGNVKDASGGDLKKAYYNFDYNVMKHGNVTSASTAHGTNSAGVATAKATTNGIIGIIPNSRMMGIVRPGASATPYASKFSDMILHLSGLETDWFNGTLYNNNQKFPLNFPAIGQQAEPIQDSGNTMPNNNPNNYSHDSFVQEGPAASIISNSWLIPVASSFTVPAELDEFRLSMSAITTLGRTRRGVPILAASTNSDNKFRSVTHYGPDRNTMMIPASSLDHLGREIKSPYSGYSEDYNLFIEVCAPSDSGSGHQQTPHAYGLPSTAVVRNQLFNNSLPDKYVSFVSEFGPNDLTLSSGSASPGSTTFTVDEGVTIHDGTNSTNPVLIPVIAMLSDGDKSEYLEVTVESNSPSAGATVTVLHNYTKSQTNSLLHSHSGGKKLKIMESVTSGTNPNIVVNNNRFTLFFGGTSAATPTVSGVIGLMISLNPNISWLEIRQILRETAIPINLRHRGVSTINNILDWKQFNPTDRYNYGTAHSIVNNEGVFIPEHLTKDVSVEPDGSKTVTYPKKNSVPENISSGTLNSNNRSITVANGADYNVRQSLLIGWESALSSDANMGDTNVQVLDGRGFRNGQILRIGRYNETPLMKVNGTNIDVSSTDGFKKGDKILIGADVVEYEIHDFGVTSTNGAYGDGGSCSRIILTSPATAVANPIGLVVKTAPSSSEEVTLSSVTFSNSGASPTSSSPQPATLVLSTGLLKDRPEDSIVRDNNSEICAILEVDNNVLTLDRPQYSHAPPYYITKGFIADYNNGFGFGRVNVRKALEAAKNYSYDSVDLYIRNNENDDGKTVALNSLSPIQSPDIFVRNQDDLDLLKQHASLNLSQNTELTIPRLISFDGTGADDLEVDAYYTGTVNELTTYTVRIESATQYSVEETNSLGTNSAAGLLIPTVFTDIFNASTGIQIKFGSGTHDIADEWIIEVRPANRQVYARVWNSGNKNSFDKAQQNNAVDVNHVRFSICVKTDNNLQLENYVLNNLRSPNPDVAFNLSTGNEGTIILNEGEQNFSEPILGKIDEAGDDTGEKHKLFIKKWEDNGTSGSNPVSLVPPRNRFNGGNTQDANNFGTKRIFVLTEVLPHDGVVKDTSNGNAITDGLSPHTNNNISFREVGFYNATFRKTGNVGLPPSTLNIETGTSTETLSVDLKALVGVFKKKNIKVKFQKDSFVAGTLPVVAEWSYDGSSAFAYVDNSVSGESTHDTAWITIAPNIAADFTTDEIKTTFETTFEADTNTSLIRVTVEVYNKEGEFLLYSRTHQIIVTTPLNLSATSSTGTNLAGEKQKALFFTQPDLIAPLGGSGAQDATMAFGPLGATNDDFNTTNLFKTISATNPLAYAVMAGDVFAQDTVDGPTGADATVNLIVKPREQGVINGLKVKYFVYRGILKSELVSGADLNVSSGSFIDMIQTADTNFNKLYEELFGTTPPPGEIVGIESLGLDLVTLPDGTPISDGFIGRGANQPIPVKKGDTLGHFHGMNGANPIGFDIILEDPNLNPVLGDVRKKQNILSYTTSGASRESEFTYRSQVLGFLDPCAFYGMHAIGGIVTAKLHSGGTPIEESYSHGDNDGNDVYNKLLKTYFLNRNTIYLDIRGAQDKTYNFSSVMTDDQIAFVLGRKGDPALKSYLTQSWPLMILKLSDIQADSTEDKKEVVRLEIAPRGGANSQVKISILSGVPFQKKMKKLVLPVKESAKTLTLDIDGSELAEDTIQFGVVNYSPDSFVSTNPVSYYFKLQYADVIGSNSEDQGSLLPKNYNFDNIFGPVPGFFDNGKNTQMMANSRNAYLDAGGSFGFQGMVETGVAKEAGRTTYYAVPSVTSMNLRGGANQFKRLVGGSFDQGFLDTILGNKLPGLHKRKREIVVGGTTINYLDVVSDEVIGNEISSPVNLMGISLTDAEIATLKTNITNLDETIYDAVLNIRSRTTNTDDNGLGYLKAEVGFCGLNSSGVYTELAETVEVYGSSGTFLSSSAAAAMETDSPAITWEDITWDKNNSGQPQVYRRLAVDIDEENMTNHKVEWELYDETGTVQTYSGTPEDVWGRTGVINAGDPIMLSAGTRVVVLGRRIIGGGANYNGNHIFYRVICWYNNEYREGFVSEYAILQENLQHRVNTRDIEFMTDLAIAEAFFTDMAFELMLLEELGIAENAVSNAPDFWDEVMRNKGRWEDVKQMVQTQGNILMPAFATEIKLLSQSENNTFTTSRRTMHADFRRFKKMETFDVIEAFDEFLIFSLDPNSDVYKEVKNLGADAYPLISEKLFTEVGESDGNNDLNASSVQYSATDNTVEKLKTELTNLIAHIDANYLVTDPIRVSADYNFINEILDPANDSNPNIITVNQALCVVFIGANGWRTGTELNHRFMNSYLPSDQSFGHVDSSTMFSLMLNECNNASAFVAPGFNTWTDLLAMVTNTQDTGAKSAYQYMKDPTHTIQSILTANGHENIDSNASLPEVLGRIFLRNSEIGLFYINEYLKEFGV